MQSSEAVGRSKGHFCKVSTKQKQEKNTIVQSSTSKAKCQLPMSMEGKLPEDKEMNESRRERSGLA